ncbi:MAG: XRE family transcriptional regulator [Verrucomicrobiae bacterium]|nr:XRE family transcriptional regulator [Verrucomicrobiae bacterium]
MDLVRVGQTLRETRLKQKMTIDQLAAKCRLSKGFLSRVENFRVTPSLHVLEKITRALGIGMADLFQSEVKSPEYLLGSLTDGEELVRDDSDKFGMKYFALAHRKLDRLLDPFIVEYHPCSKIRPFNLHETDEFFLLLEGKIRFYLFDKDHPHSLREGNTIYLSLNIPHTVQLESGCNFAKALIIYVKS